MNFPKFICCFLSNSLALSYFNLVMPYSDFSITSQEIVLFGITYIALPLPKASYRLIPNLGVYCDYDNSSILLNDNSCTLSSIGFYTFKIHIAMYFKQPCKRIRMPDYFFNNSKLHNLVV